MNNINTSEKKSAKIKNTALLKKGGYSAAITAAVLAALIILNVLVSVLSDRIGLEFDMSSDKLNSITAENLEYIKGLKDGVTVTVCADEENFASQYMTEYAKYYFNTYGNNDLKYYKQTARLIESYRAANKNITVRYIDTQDTAFTEISQKYPDEKIYYGDIIVSDNGSDRYKHITFNDIYELADESGYASYGYSNYSIGGNNIETKLTSAISYVTSGVSKKVALLTGHSANDYTDDFVSVLKDNNYTVDTISDAMVNTISDEYDAVCIAAPTGDYLDSEITALSNFLENGGKLNKGLIYFADAANPRLPVLEVFLESWGIKTLDGILYETNANYRTEDSATTMLITPASDEGITKNTGYCIAGYNVPLEAVGAADENTTATAFMTTSDSVVTAPAGSTSDWSADGETKKQYAAAIMSEKTSDDTSSRVIAFGSIEYIHSDWISNSRLSNMNVAVSAAEYAAHAEDGGMTFVTKKITDESFAESVTASSSAVVRTVFMFALPVAVLAAGIYVFVKRRNA